MGQGFQTFNDSGNLQVDSSTYAYYCIGKGSFQCFYDGDPNAPENPQPEARGGIDVPAYDLVALQSYNSYVLPFNAIQDISGIAGRDMVANPYLYSQTAAYTITGNEYEPRVFFWLFRSFKYTAPDAHGVGIETFNADGSLCYSSRYRPLMVAAHIDVNRDMENQTYGLPGNRNYAFVQYGRSIFGRPGPYAKGAGMGVNSFNGGFRLRQVGCGGLSRDGDLFNGGMLVVDVTDF